MSVILVSKKIAAKTVLQINFNKIEFTYIKDAPNSIAAGTQRTEKRRDSNVLESTSLMLLLKSNSMY